MRDFRSSTTFGAANTAIGSVHAAQAGETRPKGASNADLLLYIGDLLAELQTMATQANISGVADLLGYAHREVERSRRLL